VASIRLKKLARFLPPQAQARMRRLRRLRWLEKARDTTVLPELAAAHGLRHRHFAERPANHWYRPPRLGIANALPSPRPALV